MGESGKSAYLSIELNEWQIQHTWRIRKNERLGNLTNPFCGINSPTDKVQWTITLQRTIYLLQYTIYRYANLTNMCVCRLVCLTDFELNLNHEKLAYVIKTECSHKIPVHIVHISNFIPCKPDIYYYSIEKLQRSIFVVVLLSRSGEEWKWNNSVDFMCA